MLDTSGIKVTEKEDGTVELSYIDFGVEEFGGHDYECTYKLNKENATKFRNELSKLYSGTLEEMVILAFTKNFSDSKFNAFCKENGIDFQKTSWF